MEVPMYLCHCGNCNIPFAIPDAMDDRMRECHNDFYCPSGHKNYYPEETEVEKLHEVIKQKDARILDLERAEIERLAKLAKRKNSRKKVKK